MKMAAFALCLLTALFAGCTPRASTVAPTTGKSLRASLGQRVTLVGIAEAQKVGAALRGEDFYVYIEGLHDWPRGFDGRRVQVAGLLEERHDLPVFVADTPEERMAVAGIPVRSGTDLHKARHRFVLRDAQWTLLR
jgi:hypothetical protein